MSVCDNCKFSRRKKVKGDKWGKDCVKRGRCLSAEKEGENMLQGLRDSKTMV